METNSDFVFSLASDIFKRYENGKTNIFLCGANPNYLKEGEISKRKLLEESLEKTNNCFIVYPEWLFPKLLTKKKNLLTLEHRLVNMVDSVVIPLDTIATYAELGAFVIDPQLVKKVIVINDAHYRNKKSFVNLGPINLIKEKADVKNVILYNDFEKEYEDISAKIIKRTKEISKELGRAESNIFDLSLFILFSVSLYQPVDVRFLKKELKELNRFDLDNDFEPAIEILIKKKFLNIKTVTRKEKNYRIFSLSNEGHELLLEKELSNHSLKKKYYSLRTNYINFKHKRKFNIEGYGKKRFLDELNLTM